MCLVRNSRFGSSDLPDAPLLFFLNPLDAFVAGAPFTMSDAGPSAGRTAIPIINAAASPNKIDAHFEQWQSEYIAPHLPSGTMPRKRAVALETLPYVAKIYTFTVNITMLLGKQKGSKK